MTTWAYVAGYFDGEGHVSFHVTKRGGRTRELQWFNTHLQSLEVIRDFISCGTIRTRTPGGLGTKQQYILCVGRKRDMLHVIAGIEEHLIIKRDAVRELREFVETIDDSGMVNFGKVAAVSTEQLVRWHHEEQLSHEKIARLIGVTRTSVSRELRKRGLSQPVPNTGFVHNEEVRARMSALKKAQWADPVWAAKRRAALVNGQRRMLSEART